MNKRVNLIIGSGVLGIPYNPASVAFIKNQEGFLSKTNYVADISYQVLGYGRNLSGIDFIAFHGFFLDSGDMDVTTAEYPDGTGETYSVKAMCLRASFGKRIKELENYMNTISKIEKIEKI